jgi:Ca2+-binding EF-hand superfamily protein
MRENWKKWFVSRENAGLGTLAKLKNMALAKEIFKAWDFEKRGYLTLEQLTDQLIGLGLSTTIEFVRRLLQTLNKEKVSEILTLK